VTKLRLVIFGRQGAGKGTQSAMISEHYGVPHISTGDMLRDAAAAGTDFGRKAKEYMDAGKLLPDDIMLGVIEERLARPDVVEHGFLLDGFPRTKGQAEALWHLLGDGKGLDLAINLEVPEDIVLERIAGRGRDDDTESAITARLEAYALQTLLAIAWMDSKGVVLTIDGVGTPEEVADRLFKAIDAAVESRG
jgi:adenylate kinase